jgi:Spy/CpxP family protein refolding chaperone
MSLSLSRALSRKLLMPALLAVAIAPLALAAAADTGKGAHPGKKSGWSEQRQERLEERRQALFDRAGLDDETRAALEEAHAEHHEALRELHEQHRERLDEILDEEQRQALRDAKGEMRQERREHYRGDLQQRLTTLVDSWELSDEQREALREAREAFYADLQALRGQTFDSRDERREAWQALRDEHHAALGELLTDEQLEELEATMQPRGHRGYGKGKPSTD